MIILIGAVVTSIESIMKIVPEFLDVSGPALRVCELINSKVTWDFDLPEKGIDTLYLPILHIIVCHTLASGGHYHDDDDT